MSAAAARRVLRWTLALGAGVITSGAVAAPAAVPDVKPVSPVTPYEVVGDGIPRALGDLEGDAMRGRALVARREQGLCLLCHRAPVPEMTQQGNLASDLAGAGQRWSPAQLRLRVVDPRRLQPESLMPAFHRTQGLNQVGTAWKDRPVLTAQQVEDVVAYLSTLK